MADYYNFAEQTVRSFVQDEIENAMSCPEEFELDYNQQNKIREKIADIIWSKVNHEINDVIDYHIDDIIEQELEDYNG